MLENVQFFFFILFFPFFNIKLFSFLEINNSEYFFHVYIITFQRIFSIKNFLNSQPSYVGIDSILDFTPEILIGDEKISTKEALLLLQESEGLAYIKNKWIAVDHEKLKKTLEAYENAKALIERGGLTIREALKLQVKSDPLFGNQTDDYFWN